LHDPSEVDKDNLSNIRQEASRLFRNKKSAYLKDKIKKPESSSKNTNIRDQYRGINELGRVTNMKLTW
jgi:hypothetical protein